MFVNPARFQGGGYAAHDPEKWEPVFGRHHAPGKGPVRQARKKVKFGGLV
jgi:hypothetical protein